MTTLPAAVGTEDDLTGRPGRVPRPPAVSAAVVAARGVLGAVLRRRTWAAAAHAALAVPVGVLALGSVLPVLLPPYALLLWMLDRSVTADVTLPILLAGLVLLLPGLVLARALATVERRLAGRLLGVRATAPQGRRWRRAVLEEATWRELLWLLLRVVVATVVLTYWVLVVGVLAEASQPAGGAGTGRGAVVLLPLSVLLAVHAARGLAWLQARAALPLLGDVAAARLAEEQERSRRLEDRARLARELHDSVGHGVTLMVLQAGAARATPGDDGREALAAVERSGRAVMADLHRVLGLLDPGAAGGPDDVGTRAWSGVDDALQASSAAGLDVHRVVRPLPPDVPAAVEALVTRCLREALTNAATHAPGARVVVDLAADHEGALEDHHEDHHEDPAEPGRLVLAVRDDGAREGVVAPVLPSHRGSGLAGLRTDALALGGALSAGPAGPGFEVVLRLPLAGPA